MTEFWIAHHHSYHICCTVYYVYGGNRKSTMLECDKHKLHVTNHSINIQENISIAKMSEHTNIFVQKSMEKRPFYQWWRFQQGQTAKSHLSNIDNGEPTKKIAGQWVKLLVIIENTYKQPSLLKRARLAGILFNWWEHQHTSEKDEGLIVLNVHL